AELRRELVEGVAHESGEARAPEVGHCVAILGAGGRSPSTLVRPRTPGAPAPGPAPERGRRPTRRGLPHGRSRAARARGRTTGRARAAPAPAAHGAPALRRSCARRAPPPGAH